MAKWKKNGISLEPLFKFKCLGCRDTIAKFKEAGYALCNFPIEKGQKEYNSHAFDRSYRCDLCGWRVVFGIAVTKEHFKEMVNHNPNVRTRPIT